MSEQSDGQAKTATPDRFWFRIHNEVLHDMTFIDMSDADLGTYVRLLALANSTRSVGIVHADVTRVAKALRMSTDETESFLQRMEALDLLVRDDEMVAIIDERHFEGKGLTPSMSREAQRDRQQKRRAKLKEEGKAIRVIVKRHGDESQDIEEDSDSIEESQTEKRTYENRIDENRNTINEPSESEGPNQGDYLGGYLSHGGLDLEPHEEPLL